MGVDVVRMVCSSVKKWLGMGTIVHLYAEIFSDNQRSLHCFQENGFAVDGQREANGRMLILLSKDIH